ncbi:DUF2321 domain-containing protein [Macrococcoides caseolyticum]|uniref:DUF2321 domain-containing protein n=1 Tax=Macrococcoides caseolyticum TaxID=69966 RepID=UPI0018E1BC12|nr:DUF2321 domain-containing protein [Macrococcus caseolyticus]QQB05838.1 DUF2321 domain-containing protein [Macrococcus caseolyticus]
MGYYDPATICLNGHVASTTQANVRPFCKECGKQTISVCQSCNSPIQGAFYIPGVVTLGGKYDKPNYCHECGKAYPWTQNVIDNAIELLYLDEVIDDETKQIIKDAIPDLVVDNPSTPLAAAKYKKFIPKTAEFVQNGLRNIFIDIVSESVKKTIWPS